MGTIVVFILKQLQFCLVNLALSAMLNS